MSPHPQPAVSVRAPTADRPSRLSNDEAFKAFHFVKADVDELSALAEEMGVKAPTLQLYREGEKANEIVDATPDQLFPFLGGGL